MANIDAYLASILSAVYGRDVRGSIHDAIAAMNENNEEIISRGGVWGKTVEEITSIASNIQGLYDLSDSDTYQLISHDTDWNWITTTYGGTGSGSKALNVRGGGCIRGGNVNLTDGGISRTLTNGVLEEEIDYKFIPSWAGGNDTTRLWMAPALVSGMAPTSAPGTYESFSMAEGYRILYWSTANQRRPFFKSIYWFPTYVSMSSATGYLYSNAVYACNPQAQNAAEYVTYTISFSDNNNAAGHRPSSLTVGFDLIAGASLDGDTTDNVTHTGSPLSAQVKGYFVYNKNYLIDNAHVTGVRVNYPNVSNYTKSVSSDTLSCVYTHV